MPRILHLLSTDHHETALSVIERQVGEPGSEVTVVFLHGARVPVLPEGADVRRLADEGHPGDVTASELLDLIFAADSVMAW